jgi:hypothetical protein
MFRRKLPEKGADDATNLNCFLKVKPVLRLAKIALNPRQIITFCIFLSSSYEMLKKENDDLKISYSSVDFIRIIISSSSYENGKFFSQSFGMAGFIRTPY